MHQVVVTPETTSNGKSSAVKKQDSLIQSCTPSQAMAKMKAYSFIACSFLWISWSRVDFLRWMFSFRPLIWCSRLSFDCVMNIGRIKEQCRFLHKYVSVSVCLCQNLFISACHCASVLFLFYLCVCLWFFLSVIIFLCLLLRFKLPKLIRSRSIVVFWSRVLHSLSLKEFIAMLIVCYRVSCSHRVQFRHLLTSVALFPVIVVGKCQEWLTAWQDWHLTSLASSGIILCKQISP